MEQSGKGVSIAALVCGIVGLLVWCLPCLGYPVAMAALVCGIIGLKKQGSKWMNIVGIVVGALCLILSLVNSFAGVALQTMLQNASY